MANSGVLLGKHANILCANEIRRESEDYEIAHFGTETTGETMI